MKLQNYPSRSKNNNKVMLKQGLEPITINLKNTCYSHLMCLFGFNLFTNVRNYLVLYCTHIACATNSILIYYIMREGETVVTYGTHLKLPNYAFVVLEKETLL